NVLSPVLLAMFNHIKEVAGDRFELDTDYKDDLVGAINEVLSRSSQSGFVIRTGTGNPNLEPPAFENLGDFYQRVSVVGSETISFWQYNGNVWTEIKPDFTFHYYDDIDELIIRQAEQTPGDLILIQDAVDDSNIT